MHRPTRQRQKPRIRDLRGLYLLIGELRERGADPYCWRLHAVERLCGLIGADFAVFSEHKKTDHKLPGDWQLLGLIDHGLNDDQREIFWRFMKLGRLDEHPLTPIDAIHARVAVRRRRDFVDDQAYYQSWFYREFHHPMGMDDGIVMQMRHTKRLKQVVGFYRRSGKSHFTKVEARLLRLVGLELAGLQPTPLTNFANFSIAEMAPRLQQVLIGLLDDESEQEISTRLEISSHTVHEHVKRLYRAANVHSRADLLRKFRDLQAMLHAFPADGQLDFASQLSKATAPPWPNGSCGDGPSSGEDSVADSFSR